MTTPPDFSDIEGYGSPASDTSFEEAEPQEIIDAALQSVLGRSVTPTPQRTAGFGRSKYGPHPRDLVVANTGPAVNAQLMYRKDTLPLFRWDTRGPEIIFSEGFRNWNNLAPSSLQHYQNQNQETALVSFTREPDPTFSRPDWAVNEDGLSYRYLTFPPGGYEFLSTLQTASYSSQDEVAHWKGVRPEYVARVDIVNEEGDIIESRVNDKANPEVLAAMAQYDLENQHTGNEAEAHPTDSAPGHMMDARPTGFAPWDKGFQGYQAGQYLPAQHSDRSSKQPQSPQRDTQKPYSPQSSDPAKGQGRARGAR
ncbi:scabin-related ADP-ribosyltransferase [Streptomyces fumanus]|uniref:scabin-related ADP-ribosyltransferase n=1 Tax=Streptomyces fumanus TaxID=67302 RepID=UPI0033E67DC6